MKKFTWQLFFEKFPRCRKNSKYYKFYLEEGFARAGGWSDDPIGTKCPELSKFFDRGHDIDTIRGWPKYIRAIRDKGFHFMEAYDWFYQSPNELRFNETKTKYNQIQHLLKKHENQIKKFVAKQPKEKKGDPYGMEWEVSYE